MSDYTFCSRRTVSALFRVCTSSSQNYLLHHAKNFLMLKFTGNCMASLAGQLSERLRTISKTEFVLSFALLNLTFEVYEYIVYAFHFPSAENHPVK